MKNKISIVYDNWCPNCKRFISIVKFLDWLKLIYYVELRNPKSTNTLTGFDLVLAGQQMASFDDKWHYGFYSIYQILVRLPLFWLILPILFVLKITKFGQILYMEIALKRKIIPLHCDDKICLIEE